MHCRELSDNVGAGQRGYGDVTVRISAEPIEYKSVNYTTAFAQKPVRQECHVRQVIPITTCTARSIWLRQGSEYQAVSVLLLCIVGCRCEVNC